jgi:predicted Fe-S protein YdhL (DUF1289 family)
MTEGSDAKAPPTATSPCTGVCALDRRTGLCIGCGRTTAEITAWPYMSEAQRLAWISAAQARGRES